MAESNKNACIIRTDEQVSSPDTVGPQGMFLSLVLVEVYANIGQPRTYLVQD